MNHLAGETKNYKGTVGLQFHLYVRLGYMFEDIVEKINHRFNLTVNEIETISWGADFSCQKYLLRAHAGQSYFMKQCKTNKFNELQFLEYLNEKIGESIIAPIKCINGDPHYFDGDLYYSIFPYIDGKNGFEQELSSNDLKNVGRILKRVHRIDKKKIKKEFGIPSHKIAFQLVQKLNDINNDNTINPFDELSDKLLVFLNTHHSEIVELIDISRSLAEMVVDNEEEYVLCHSDVHAGNILKSKDEIFLIDWDQPVFANKELDLLFFGGGIAGKINSEEDENAFLAGYGETEIDYRLIVLFQIFRIFEDIYIYHNLILNGKQTADERYMSFNYLKENFAPGNTIDCTYRFLERIK